jgi:hypothetical protein
VSYNALLDDYITVGQRLLKARQHILIITSESPVMLSEVLGYIRVTIELKDGRKATGIGSFRLDATKSAQKTNPLEDAETSALGRALKFLGFDDSKKIASLEEVNDAQERMKEPSASHRLRAQKRVEELVQQVRQSNMVIKHPMALQPLTDIPYDDLLEYGKYLKSLVDGNIATSIEE